MRRFQIAAAFGAVLFMSWPAAEVTHSSPPLYTIEDLGTLNGAPLTPRAINAAGHVAGLAETIDGAHVAFLLDTETRDLGSLGGTWTEANAVSERDEVAGFSMNGDGMAQAFRYMPATGIQLLLPSDGTPSFAFAVNAAGQ